MVVTVGTINGTPTEVVTPPLITLIPQVVVSPEPPTPAGRPVTMVPVTAAETFQVPTVVASARDNVSAVAGDYRFIVPDPQPTSDRAKLALSEPTTIFLVVNDDRCEGLTAVAI